MKIIISPAKKMNVDTDTYSCTSLPVFLDQTKEILAFLQSLSYEELQKIWNCNDKIAQQNFQRLQNMNLESCLTPALISYEGIQYQYMAPGVFTSEQLDYICDHLRIISGFYGILKPFDGVTPYRLEMQSKAKPAGKKDLYDYWGNRLYQELTSTDHVILNLASKEYSKCIEKHLTSEDHLITCIFGEISGEKVIQKGTLAKMARGEMVRFLAEVNGRMPEDAKAFDRLGFQFREDLSSAKEYVFIKMR
ncbi:MAG: peroxide stress protein YaaA [Brotaphodocola sp.]